MNTREKRFSRKKGAMSRFQKSLLRNHLPSHRPVTEISRTIPMAVSLYEWGRFVAHMLIADVSISQIIMATVNTSKPAVVSLAVSPAFPERETYLNVVPIGRPPMELPSVPMALI